MSAVINNEYAISGPMKSPLHQPPIGQVAVEPGYSQGGPEVMRIHSGFSQSAHSQSGYNWKQKRMQQHQVRITVALIISS